MSVWCALWIAFDNIENVLFFLKMSQNQTYPVWFFYAFPFLLAFAERLIPERQEPKSLKTSTDA